MQLLTETTQAERKSWRDMEKWKSTLISDVAGQSVFLGGGGGATWPSETKEGPGE